MKKILSILLAIILFSCGVPSQPEKIIPTKAIFKVSKIEPVNDTIKNLCKYEIIPDSSIRVSGYTNSSLLSFEIIDTSGKYEVNQNLIFILQPDTYNTY